MKRHLLPMVALLLLASCTAVEDFGAYWGKGAVDPALEGTWKKIGRPGTKPESTAGSDQLVFVKDGQSYLMQAINPIEQGLPDEVARQRKEDNDARFTVRTLRIGNHSYFMVRGTDGKPNGVIERYEITGDVLREYFLENEVFVDFLQPKHASAKNIQGSKAQGHSVVIHTFDDEVFRILSEISDDTAYWYLEGQYARAR
jgi:hypothetical protein